MPVGPNTTDYLEGDRESKSLAVYEIANGAYSPYVVRHDGGGNLAPAMDAAARPGFFSLVLGGAVISGGNPVPVTGTITAVTTVTTLTTITNPVTVTGTVAVTGAVSTTGTAVVSGSVTADTELTTADLDTGGGTDTRAVVGVVYGASGGGVTVTYAAPFPTAAIAVTAGGTSLPYSFLSTAAVQAAAIKASPGQVYALHFFNVGAAAVYVRLYNQTGSPGTGDTVVYRAMIPGNTAGAGFVVPIPPGVEFTTGIGIRVTAAIADNDNTALSANQVMGNVFYK